MRPVKSFEHFLIASNWHVHKFHSDLSLPLLHLPQLWCQNLIQHNQLQKKGQGLLTTIFHKKWTTSEYKWGNFKVRINFSWCQGNWLSLLLHLYVSSTEWLNDGLSFIMYCDCFPTSLCLNLMEITEISFFNPLTVSLPLKQFSLFREFMI